VFSRNTFGALELLDRFELALLLLSHLYISMPRAAGRKVPREPRNESGASTIAGPSRGPRAPAALARRPRQPEDEDDVDDKEELLGHRRRLRETAAPPTRFAPAGGAARPPTSPEGNHRSTYILRTRRYTNRNRLWKAQAPPASSTRRLAQS
jgi:hypothetical protein